MNSTWQLQPIFGSYLLVAGLAATLFGLLILTPGFGQLSIAKKRWLIGIRAVLAALLVLAMLRPTLIVTDRELQTTLLPILFDVSRSMDFRDGDDGKTRWQQQQELLKKILPQLEDLGSAFEVEFIGFSGAPGPATPLDGQLRLGGKPQGDQTDLGRALVDTLERYLGRRMAGVILMSDGAQRAFVAETSPQQAARQLDRLAVPLYTVAIGRDRDQSQARDVAIENLLDEYSVFVKNEFALRVGVRIQGYANRPIPVSLFVEDAAGVRDKVGTREVVATQESQTVMVDFTYRADQPGKYRLYLQAEHQPGELIENNEAVAFLEVRDGGLRVLLLTSATGWEEAKFIRRSLAASREIDLDYQRIDVHAKNRWPIDLKSRVTLDEYDVFVVGDLAAEAIPNENWSEIAKLVEAGRGFMMFGGFHSFGPGGYANTPLATLLPVLLDANEREPNPTTTVRSDRHLTGELNVLPIRSSSITYFAQAKAANDARWAALKPILGANKLDRLREQATVIAETKNGEALLVQMNYLGGRVLASAMDTTWRWWKYGQAEQHKRFWRQCILWLARRDQQEANTVVIDLPQRRFTAGSSISFRAALTDEVGDQVADANLKATLRSPDGQLEELPMVSDNNGHQLGTIRTDQDTTEGVYRILVQAIDGLGRPTTESYAEFVVTKEDFELTDPAANPGLLDMLARMTARVGGKAVAPEQLSQLIADIKANPPENSLELQSKWQLGDRWWDAWGCFLALTLLLSADWILRKRWGLV